MSMNICVGINRNVMWVSIYVCDSMNKEMILNACLGDRRAWIFMWIVTGLGGWVLVNMSLNKTLSKSITVWLYADISLIVNLSDRVIMNMSVSINLNGGSSMIRYMNISMYMNLLMSLSGSKNMKMCVSKSVSAWAWVKVWVKKMNLSVFG